MPAHCKNTGQDLPQGLEHSFQASVSHLRCLRWGSCLLSKHFLGGPHCSELLASLNQAKSENGLTSLIVRSMKCVCQVGLAGMNSL